MRLDWIEWDGIGWAKMRWNGIRQNEMGLDSISWDGIAWDKMAWGGLG